MGDFTNNSTYEAIKYNNALQDAYNFYNTDVVSRRNRERSALLHKLYTNPNPIILAKIGVGDTQIQPSLFEQNNYEWSSGDDVGGYLQGLKGVVIAPSQLKDTTDRLALTITHEFTHEDQHPNRKSPNLQTVLQIMGLFNNSSGITRKEASYLKTAYGLPTDTNTGADRLSEMHATNRELRHHLYQLFKDLYGRDPENIEELDLYIDHFSNELLLDLLIDQNDYGRRYGAMYVTDNKGRIAPNFSDINKKAESIKEALKHVAFNQSNSNAFLSVLAKHGGRLNYLQFFKPGGKTKSFEEWYQTVPENKRDTTNYNLRLAYELLPQEELDNFVNKRNAHLRSVAYDEATDTYQFLKSKNHPSLQKELEWYYSRKGKDFRDKYSLDTSGNYYKYIHK